MAVGIVVVRPLMYPSLPAFWGQCLWVIQNKTGKKANKCEKLFCGYQVLEEVYHEGKHLFVNSQSRGKFHCGRGIMRRV